MTQQEAILKVEELVKNHSDEYTHFGVRFDSKKYEVGEYTHLSKTNIDREDKREFPEFESEEYKELETLIGTCVYDSDYWMDYIDVEDEDNDEYNIYVIAGEKYEEGEDRDEMIIEEAVVIGVLNR